MKKAKLFLILLTMTVTMSMKSQEKEIKLLIETNLGAIKVKLYNETPKHRDNMVKLVKDGFYKDLLFHRVIENFMIQGGDPSSRTAKEGEALGEGDLDYMIDAEFRSPSIFHRRGVLAAARQGDASNPERASSASQFYIVTGQTYTDQVLDKMEKDRFEVLKLDVQKRIQAESSDKIKELYKAGNRDSLFEFRQGLITKAQAEAEARKGEVLFTEEQRDVYKVIGGVPRLDGAYTVFGEVVEGMTIVDQIEKVETNGKDRPLQNVVMNVTLLED